MSGVNTVLRAVGIEQQYHNVNHAEKFTDSILENKAFRLNMSTTHTPLQSIDLLQTVKIKQHPFHSINSNRHLN